MRLTFLLALSLGALTMQAVADPPPKAKPQTAKVTTTLYHPDGSVRGTAAKDHPVTAGFTGRLKLEHADPKTGKVLLVMDGVPAQPAGGGAAWRIPRNVTNHQFLKGDRVTDAAGKVYTLKENARASGRGWLLQVNPPAGK